MASTQQTLPSSSTVTFLGVFTSDAGSSMTDFLTLADYQRLLCTCKTVSIHTAAEKKKKVKDFLLECEIVLLLNGNEHDTLTKRMIDCIRLGSSHYHVEQRAEDEAQDRDEAPGSGTLSDAFGSLLSLDYAHSDSMDYIENKHVVHGRCLSRFCRSATKTEEKRLYLVTNGNDNDTGTNQIRAYCTSCILDDVCLALRFFALQDVQTNMGETWCLGLEWEDASSDAFIVSCFSYEPYVSWTYYFVGGQHHASINAKETLEREKEQEEKRATHSMARAPIASRQQQHVQQATSHDLFGSSDIEDEDDGINDTNNREENTRMHPESKRQRTNPESHARHDLFGSSDDEE